MRAMASWRSEDDGDGGGGEGGGEGAGEGAGDSSGECCAVGRRKAARSGTGDDRGVRALAASDRADAAARAAAAEAAATSSSRTASALTLRRIAAFFRSSSSFETGPRTPAEAAEERGKEAVVADVANMAGIAKPAADAEAAGSGLSEPRTGRRAPGLPKAPAAAGGACCVTDAGVRGERLQEDPDCPRPSESESEWDSAGRLAETAAAALSRRRRSADGSEGTTTCRGGGAAAADPGAPL